MLRVGLTGGIATGKTTVCNIFSEIGVPVIDADMISHQLVGKGKPALEYIKREFGNKILDKNDELDRDQMRNIIFKDQRSKMVLENILHPLIYNEIEKQVSKLDYPYCIICIPLLLETKSENKVDRILLVDVQNETQIKRAVLRDKSNAMDIKRIIGVQVPREERLRVADDIIMNDGDIADLRRKIQDLHNKYNKLSAKYRTNYTDIN